MVFRFRVLLVVIAVSMGLAIMLPTGHALAAGPTITLTTSPVSLNLRIKPGTSNVQTLQFKNGSSIPLPMTVQVKVFGAYGTSGEAAITDPPANNPSASYVSLTPSTFTAQPNVWTAVKMTINLPKSAGLGYYYAIVFKPTLPTQAPSARSTTVKGSNAILVLVDSGSANEKRQVQVTNFSATKHIYQYLPAHFNVTIRNTGNIYLAPSGDIFISRHSDMTDAIANIPFNHAAANVLPNSNRSFQTSWTDGFPLFQQKQLAGQPVTDAKGRPVQQLVWNFSSPLSKFRFGKYYAQLALTYNDGTGNRLVVSQVSFWVVPWELILMILGAITGLIIIWTYFKKGIKKLWRKFIRR